MSDLLSIRDRYNQIVINYQYSEIYNPKNLNIERYIISISIFLINDLTRVNKSAQYALSLLYWPSIIKSLIVFENDIGALGPNILYIMGFSKLLQQEQ